MSEQIGSPEFGGTLRERRSILASYVMRAILAASSEGFKQDLAEAIAYVEGHTHYATGAAITEGDIQALASSSILVQMVESFQHKQPIILSPDIPQALPVYVEAQKAIDEVGLTLALPDLDMPTVLATAQRLNEKDVPTTPNIEAAVTVLKQRGTVLIEMESIDDISRAMGVKDYSSEAPDTYYEEDGIQVEAHDLARLEIPSRLEELPYYAQFSEVEHGSEWLNSLLVDIQAINTRMHQVS
jgi:hypothetical protein